ncbi:unnamed protein product [Didymodactylos carnosus]|uniref:Ig-like domain-containing protein n=1 Tax=Didymodactylos carnosus TaxID=1234261 RepID=A0A813RXE3_9BILA|nr:unnamed protein product [Didymodactylos carnosus]CAF0960860.1 unnamed protein product [Didymodactylos carnosus]CAF3572239.1 unnamed protein product [Didymodactylos carnosus]CAF3733745.1 unnamed protein product [Didymodactylos carnosus]
MYQFNNSRYFPNGWLPPPRPSPRSQSDKLYKPVSKSFNRISDFIFPDTIHIRLKDSNPFMNKLSHRPTLMTDTRGYNRIENYSLPVLNHRNKRDLIIVERLPIEKMKDVDVLYKEQKKEHSYGTRRLLTTQPLCDRRRYSSIVQSSDFQKSPLNNYFSPGHDRSNIIVNNRTNRSATYRERVRDRRKRHTTDDAYHTIMKSIVDDNARVPNCVLSCTTALEPITDSDSLLSLSLGGEGYQEQNNISLEDWRRQTHYRINTRVPQNGIDISETIPYSSQLQQQKNNQYKRGSTLSSRCTTLDTSSDSDSQSIRQMNNGDVISYQQQNTIYPENSLQSRVPLLNYQENRYGQRQLPVIKGPPAISLPRQAIWERVDNKNSVRMRHEPDTYFPVHEIENYSNHNNNHLIINDHAEQHYNKNNQTNINENKHPHHVSLCVNDLHTTLFIDEDTLNNSKNSNKSNGGGVSVHRFIDRIMKRLLQFKRALDNGLVHVRKRESLNLENSVINNEKFLKHDTLRSNNHHNYQDLQRNMEKNDQLSYQGLWSLDNKFVPPYLVIRPQSALVLPNEIAKFKCCFGGDPVPSLKWYHNDREISNTNENNTKYRLFKAHDIHYLDIGPVTMKDNGNIKCYIENKLGREETIVQLIVARSASDATPRIIQSLQNTSVQEGKPLKLLCTISGPLIDVKWYHNDKLVSPTVLPKSNFKGENAIFTLSKVTRADSGIFICVIRNRFGEARTSCKMDVIENQ